MSQMANWSEMGVDPNSIIINILYNRASNCVLARYRRILNENAIPIDELYFRHADNPKYTKVTLGNGAYSLTDAVSCRHKPCAFFLAQKLEGPTSAVYSTTVHELQLPTGDLKVVLDSATIRGPKEYQSCWIASVMEIAEEGVLTCRVGLDRQTGAHSSATEYWICDIDLRDGSVVKLARLPYVFA